MVCELVNVRGRVYGMSVVQADRMRMIARYLGNDNVKVSGDVVVYGGLR